MLSAMLMRNASLSMIPNALKAPTATKWAYASLLLPPGSMRNPCCPSVPLGSAESAVLVTRKMTRDVSHVHAKLILART